MPKVNPRFREASKEDSLLEFTSKLVTLNRIDGMVLDGYTREEAKAYIKKHGAMGMPAPRKVE